MAHRLARRIGGAGGGIGAEALAGDSLRCDGFVAGIPSGTKARIDSVGFMYGLKPVPFKLKPVSFTLKPVPFNGAHSSVARVAGGCA